MSIYIYESWGRVIIRSASRIYVRDNINFSIIYYLLRTYLRSFVTTIYYDTYYYYNRLVSCLRVLKSNLISGEGLDTGNTSKGPSPLPRLPITIIEFYNSKCPFIHVRSATEVH